jgi:hypothetical protein
VRTPVDRRLREEAARFAFRFACDDCAHFEARAERCSLGYPASPRREALGGSADAQEHVEMCKEYELA